LALVYALDVPVALRAVDRAIRATVERAMVKTGILAATYVVTYVGTGVWSLRVAKAIAKGE
jgi:hypothetical protein